MSKLRRADGLVYAFSSRINEGRGSAHGFSAVGKLLHIQVGVDIDTAHNGDLGNIQVERNTDGGLVVQMKILDKGLRLIRCLLYTSPSPRDA